MRSEQRSDRIFFETRASSRYVANEGSNALVAFTQSCGAAHVYMCATAL
jgi:hypothetical protein